MACRAAERGFTLLEVMITMAIIAILAAIVIPTFTSESLRAKANIEVPSFFTEMSSRQEQFKIDNGAYASTAECPTGAPNGQERSVLGCIGAGQPWQPLNMLLPKNDAYCTYESVAGSGTGTNNPLGFNFTSPPMRWYYLVARCDMDNDGTVATYFQASNDSTIQKLNEGE